MTELEKLGIQVVDVDRVEAHVRSHINVGDKLTSFKKQIAEVDKELAKATRREDEENIQKFIKEKEKLQDEIVHLTKKLDKAEQPISKWDLDDVEDAPEEDVPGKEPEAKKLIVPPLPKIGFNLGKNKDAPTSKNLGRGYEPSSSSTAPPPSGSSRQPELPIPNRSHTTRIFHPEEIERQQRIEEQYARVRPQSSPEDHRRRRDDPLKSRKSPLIHNHSTRDHGHQQHRTQDGNRIRPPENNRSRTMDDGRMRPKDNISQHPQRSPGIRVKKQLPETTIILDSSSEEEVKPPPVPSRSSPTQTMSRPKVPSGTFISLDSSDDEPPPQPPPVRIKEDPYGPAAKKQKVNDTSEKKISAEDIFGPGFAETGFSQVTTCAKPHRPNAGVKLELRSSSVSTLSFRNKVKPEPLATPVPARSRTPPGKVISLDSSDEEPPVSNDAGIKLEQRIREAQMQTPSVLQRSATSASRVVDPTARASRDFLALQQQMEEQRAKKKRARSRESKDTRNSRNSGESSVPVRDLKPDMSKLTAASDRLEWMQQRKARMQRRRDEEIRVKREEKGKQQAIEQAKIPLLPPRRDDLSDALVVSKDEKQRDLYPIQAKDMIPNAKVPQKYVDMVRRFNAPKKVDPVDWHEKAAEKESKQNSKLSGSTNYESLKNRSIKLPAQDDANDEFYRRRTANEDMLRDMKNAHWIVDRELRCPQYIWDLLYDYQRQCLMWLFQLHQAGTGGILADEMGLGKTVQICAFLASLHCSNILQNLTVASDTGQHRTGGVLLICPATLMQQWRDELRTWFPVIRVSVMHNVSDDTKRAQMDCAVENNGVIVTTYQTFRLMEDTILMYPWVYVILDEGHHIRNPDVAVTLSVKKIHTHRRIILSGSPIQNNLKDLWSIMDFCAPGLLGTYPFFEAQFAQKIEDGSRLNASPKQVEEAYQCAVILRDLTAPHLLRRTKGDVMEMLQLPAKQEHLIFCHLSPEQYQVYIDFLSTDQVKTALANRGKFRGGVPQSFFCISVLRKLCNHPDILLKDDPDLKPPDYGEPKRAGKMQVLLDILIAWHGEKHKVLIFSQTVMALEIIERMCLGAGFTFMRIDGKTAVKHRVNIIENFNKDPDCFIMLLTTRVGGVGLNITGANRVIIFDPDWNPMVDVQARERAWRIGQKREVTVYRLISVGTVEEKMYHRQVFKHFLAQKVLTDTRQRRFFKENDLKDLFSAPPPPPNFDPTSMKLSHHYRNLFAKYRHTSDVLETDCVLGELQLLPLPDQHVPSGGATNEHKNIMSKLFSQNQYIRSEFSHDKVEQPMLEERLVQHGKQHAQRTLKALTNNAALRMNHPVNAPTWTGKTGVAGRGILEDADAGMGRENSPRRKIDAGLLGKNMDILSRRLRQQAHEDNRAPVILHVADKKIAESILALFLDKSKCPHRRASTGLVLDHFNPRVPSHSQNLFKSLLKQMCFQDKQGACSFWVLKDEYG